MNIILIYDNTFKCNQCNNTLESLGNLFNITQYEFDKFIDKEFITYECKSCNLKYKCLLRIFKTVV